MSYTSTYAVYKTKARSIAEHRNSHGSGPAIWDYISLKLTGHKFNWLDASEDGKFWPLWKDTRLDDDERAVLLCTYDHGIVEVARLADFARACRKLHGLILSKAGWTWSHFEAIANDAEQLSKKHDHGCLGLGIGCTSVSDPWEQQGASAKAWGIYQAIAKRSPP